MIWNASCLNQTQHLGIFLTDLLLQHWQVKASLSVITALSELVSVALSKYSLLVDASLSRRHLMLSAPSRSRFSIPYPLLKGLINCSKVKATYKFCCQMTHCHYMHNCVFFLSVWCVLLTGVTLAQRGWSAESTGPERPVWSMAVIRVGWTRSGRRRGRKTRTIAASRPHTEDVVDAAAESASDHATTVTAQTR